MIPVPRMLVSKAALMCGQAFQNSEAFTWIIPDPEKRRQILASIFEARLKFALLSGQVFTTSPRVEAIAQLIPSRRSSYTLPKIMRSGILPVAIKMGREAFSRMMALGKESDAAAKRVVSGEFMSLLGVAVDPVFQGKGFASKILRPMMHSLDEQGLQCALETTTESYVTLYEHLGFKTVLDTPLAVTHGKVHMWFMVRQARDDR